MSRFKQFLDERKTVDVGKIVPLPGNKAGILINGKPEGNVYTKVENGKKILFIELFGQTLRIEPSGPNGKMSREDDIQMKLDVADLYLKGKN